MTIAVLFDALEHFVQLDWKWSCSASTNWQIFNGMCTQAPGGAVVGMVMVVVLNDDVAMVLALVGATTGRLLRGDDPGYVAVLLGDAHCFDVSVVVVVVG